MSEAVFKVKAPIYMGKLMQDFPEWGLLDAAACMGNLGHESGGLTVFQEISPTVKGSRGGFGWGQWTGARRVAFEAYCSRNGLDPRSDTANYAWLFLELKGSEKKAIAATAKAEGLYNKVVAFEKAYERAGIKHYDSRHKWAKMALVAAEAERVLPPPAKPPVRREEREVTTRTSSAMWWNRLMGWGLLALAVLIVLGIAVTAALAQSVEVTEPTASEQLVEWVFSVLAAVATPVVAWVGWKISQWLTEKKLMSKAQTDVLIGGNLNTGALKAIEYAKAKVGPHLANALDDVTARNAVIKVAADYLVPKMRESIDHFGFSPQEIEDFIEARLGVSTPAAAPSSGAQAGALAGVIAAQIGANLKRDLEEFVSGLKPKSVATQPRTLKASTKPRVRRTKKAS